MERKHRESPITVPVGLLKAKDAAAYLGISVRTLGRLKIPRYLLIGRTIRYAKADLDTFIASCRYDPLAPISIETWTAQPYSKPATALLELLGPPRSRRSRKKKAA